MRQAGARLATMRRWVRNEQATFARVGPEIGALRDFGPSEEPYFDRLEDQVDRLLTSIEAAANAMGMVLDLQLNERAYVVSVVATIFVPLTFITGFFGMNFGWMVDQVDSPVAFWLLGFARSDRNGGAVLASSGTPVPHRRPAVARVTPELQTTQNTACDTCSVSRQAEIIRRGIDAFNRRDMGVLAAISTEDVEIRPAAQTAVEGSAVYRGTRAWTSYFSFIGEIWEDWRVEDAELLDAQDGRLVAITRMSGTGVRSGGSVERTFGLVFSFRDDQIKRLDGYEDARAALVAAGLEPDPS